MARIRSVKPSFWTSATTAKLSRDARLLVVGLISFADDDGRFPASINAISGYIFPHDEIAPKKIREWLTEVKNAGIVHLYEVGGLQYGCLPMWHSHQVINRYTASVLPEPDCQWVRKGEKEARP